MGIDGADWSVVRELWSQGKLPHLRRLADRGSSAVLHTDSAVSPVIWTTIATGHRPRVHGITDFVVHTPTGDVPVSASLRRVPALWNMASTAGLDVGVVSWWASWPAEAVNGVVVSDRALLDVAEALSPATFRPRFDEMRRAALARPGRFGGDPATARRDQVTAEVSLRLAAETNDLLLVYFRGVDVASHHYWRHFRPAGFVADAGPRPRRRGAARLRGGRRGDRRPRRRRPAGQLRRRLRPRFRAAAARGGRRHPRLRAGARSARLLDRREGRHRLQPHARLQPRDTAHLRPPAAPLRDSRHEAWSQGAAERGRPGAAGARPGARARHLGGWQPRLHPPRPHLAGGEGRGRAHRRLRAGARHAGAARGRAPGARGGRRRCRASRAPTTPRPTASSSPPAPTSRSARSFRGITIYDVAPTVLRALRLPIAEDFAGVVRDELFTAAIRQSPARTIATWGKPQAAAPPARRPTRSCCASCGRSATSSSRSRERRGPPRPPFPARRRARVRLASRRIQWLSPAPCMASKS